ncbi:MAG: hypothetical protein RLZZ628_3536, partial [Bacteroidota bacterium]
PLTWLWFIFCVFFFLFLQKKKKKKKRISIQRVFLNLSFLFAHKVRETWKVSRTCYLSNMPISSFLKKCHFFLTNPLTSSAESTTFAAQLCGKLCTQTICLIKIFKRFQSSVNNENFNDFVTNYVGYDTFSTRVNKTCECEVRYAFVLRQ